MPPSSPPARLLARGNRPCGSRPRMASWAALPKPRLGGGPGPGPTALAPGPDTLAWGVRPGVSDDRHRPAEGVALRLGFIDRAYHLGFEMGIDRAQWGSVDDLSNLVP